MTRFLFTGSFDPVTYGHLDIIGRASNLCDELIVGVAVNISKNMLFSVEERVEMLETLCADNHKVRVVPIGGLVAEAAKKLQATAIVRSIRNGADYEYEAQMAALNHQLNSTCETILLTASPELAACSSSAVREIASFGGDVSSFVPETVAKKLCERYSR